MNIKKTLRTMEFLCAGVECDFPLDVYDDENDTVESYFANTSNLEKFGQKYPDASFSFGVVGEDEKAFAVVVRVERERVEGMKALELAPSVVVEGENYAWGLWKLSEAVPAVGTTELSDVVEAIGGDLSEMVPLPGGSGVRVTGGQVVYSLEELWDFFCGDGEEPAAGDDSPAVEDESDPAVDDSQPAEDDNYPAGVHPLPAEWSAKLAFGSGADEKKWKNKEVDLTALIGGLTAHMEGDKDGRAFLQGACVDGSRVAKAMSEISIIGVDIDNGLPSEDIDALIAAKGLFAIRYTTHSHGKDCIEVNNDAYQKWIEKNPGTGPAEYLQAVKRYLPEVAKTAKIAGKVHRKTGHMLQIKHDPIDKNRVIFILHSPWQAGVYNTTQEGINQWKRAYAAFCEWLGIDYDQSCVDPSRLFYTPRHSKGAPYEVKVHEGGSVDIFSLPPAAYVPGVDKGKPKGGNVFLDAANDMGAREDDGASPAMKKWAVKFGHSFEIVDALEASGEVEWRTEYDNSTKRHLACPFEDEHTEPGGGGFYVENASDSDAGFAANCRHHSCADRDRLDFLQAMVDQGWLTEDALTSRDYLALTEENESEVAPLENSEGSPTLSPVDVEKALKKLAKSSASDLVVKAEIARIAKEVKGSGLTKSDIQSQYKKIKRELGNNTETTEEEGGDKRKTFTTSSDFRETADSALKTLEEANDPPSIFKFDNEISRVIRDDSGQVQIEPLNVSMLRHEVSKIARWVNVFGEQPVEIAPPREIVEDILAMPPHAVKFPVLEGVVGTPVFTRDGMLHKTPGYDPESKTFYQPLPDFDMDDVPEEPTEEDVEYAKELILDNVLIDFPFDGDSERAHAVALMLLPFARNMIQGQTPLHWIDKPSPGTGASKLVNCVSLLAIGAEADPITEESREEEWKKKITSVLKTGSPLFFLDNVNGKLDSAALATAITTPRWKDRALGGNGTVNVPVRCAFVVAGNNVVMSSELVRRAVRIRLDTKMEQPANRTDFKHANLEEWIKENRSELVWACCVLIQNWIAEGRQNFTGNQLGSFEPWSRVMGGILEAAGIPSFLDNKKEVQEAVDEETQALKSFLELWWHKYRKNPTTVKGKGEDDEHSLFALSSQVDGLPIYATSDEARRTKLGLYISKQKGRCFTIESDDGPVTVKVDSPGRASGGEGRGILWHLTPTE